MRDLLLCILLIAFAACGETGSKSEDSGRIRLLDNVAGQRDERFLAWGATVTIGEVSHPAISSSKPIVPPADVTSEEGGGRKIGARIPEELRAVPWLLFETVTTLGTQVKMMRVWPVTGLVAGSAYAVPLLEERVAGGAPGIVLWPVPDLAARDVETNDVRVPERAVLRVATGVEQTSWDSTVVPLEMTVAVLVDGAETVLRTARIEVQRRDAKRWSDLSIPLEAVGGRSVRFRFRTRPSMGPTAMASLPVWGDPRIDMTTGDPRGATSARAER